MLFVSIITPVHNVEAYLSECLDSIVKQDFTDYEVIIVDDGSTDNSPSICDEYAERYPQLRVFHKENGGVSSARNIGLDVAKGEWIWFVDADDWVERNSLQILHEAVSSHETDIIYFGWDMIRDNEIWHASVQNRLHMEKSHFLRTVICDTHQSILYKREVIETNNIRFSHGMKMGEDLEFQYKFLLHCNSPILICPTLYYVRVRKGSASRNAETRKNSLYGNLMILKNMQAYLSSCPDKGLDWMGIRMENRVKNLVKAAGGLSEIKHSEIQEKARCFIDKFRKFGYKEFDSITIKLIYLDIRLYYFLFLIHKYLRKSFLAFFNRVGLDILGNKTRRRNKCHL